MRTFFTADTHFGHTNIIKYESRPFSSIEEHDEGLINNWNNIVAPNDKVYHLGDFAFLRNRSRAIELIKRLNGTIFYIWGNHDKELHKFEDYISVNFPNKFVFLGHYHKLKHEGELIILTHYAFKIWDRAHYGSWHLYGHSHGNLPDDPHARCIDVGVDCHNYRPINFHQIREIMSKKLWMPIDHHGTHEEAGGIGLSKEAYAKENRKRLYNQLKKEFE